jgi:hypothetical protein
MGINSIPVLQSLFDIPEIRLRLEKPAGASRLSARGFLRRSCQVRRENYASGDELAGLLPAVVHSQKGFRAGEIFG